MARVLGAVRLSSETEQSLSPATQIEKISGWTSLHDHVLVDTAIDLDVSGSISPFSRPDLGKWLKPELAETWDIILVQKIDRLGRSMFDFLYFCKWCEAHGKSIVSVEENLDFGTAQGRAFVQVLMVFAEFYREILSQNRREAARKLREAGRHGGGKPGYGWEAFQVNSVWYLRIDPEEQENAERIAALLIAGHSREAIARDLNSEDIASPYGKAWTGTGIREVMTNPALLGYVMHEKQIVRDASGVAIRRMDSDGNYLQVLDDSTYEQAQAAIQRQALNTSGIQANASLLLEVAFCGRCGSPMHSNRQRFKRHGHDYDYKRYRCKASKSIPKTCNLPQIDMDKLNDAVMDVILIVAAHLPMRRRIPHGPDNNAELIAAQDEALDYLQEQIRARPELVSRLVATMAQVQADRDRLALLPSRAAWTEWLPTGESFGAFWAGLDPEGRHAFMLTSGVRAYVGGLPPAVALPVPIDQASQHAWTIAHVGAVPVWVHLGSIQELQQLAASEHSE